MVILTIVNFDYCNNIYLTTVRDIYATSKRYYKKQIIQLFYLNPGHVVLFLVFKI